MSFSALRAALLVVVAGAGFALLSGCEDEGPFEEAGEEIEDSIDDAGDALEDAADEIEDEF